MTANSLSKYVSMLNWIVINGSVLFRNADTLLFVGMPVAEHLNALERDHGITVLWLAKATPMQPRIPYWIVITDTPYWFAIADDGDAQRMAYPECIGNSIPIKCATMCFPSLIIKFSNGHYLVCDINDDSIEFVDECGEHGDCASILGFISRAIAIIRNPGGDLSLSHYIFPKDKYPIGRDWLVVGEEFENIVVETPLMNNALVTFVLPTDEDDFVINYKTSALPIEMSGELPIHRISGCLVYQNVVYYGYAGNWLKRAPPAEIIECRFVYALCADGKLYRIIDEQGFKEADGMPSDAKIALPRPKSGIRKPPAA